jgi:hypothetical protein
MPPRDALCFRKIMRPGLPSEQHIRVTEVPVVVTPPHKSKDRIVLPVCASSRRLQIGSFPEYMEHGPSGLMAPTNFCRKYPNGRFLSKLMRRRRLYLKVRQGPAMHVRAWLPGSRPRSRSLPTRRSSGRNRLTSVHRTRASCTLTRSLHPLGPRRSTLAASASSRRTDGTRIIEAPRLLWLRRRYGIWSDPR